jgi:hypothetical protein
MFTNIVIAIVLVLVALLGFAATRPDPRDRESQDFEETLTCDL